MVGNFFKDLLSLETLQELQCKEKLQILKNKNSQIEENLKKIEKKDRKDGKILDRSKVRREKGKN